MSAKYPNENSTTEVEENKYVSTAMAGDKDHDKEIFAFVKLRKRFKKAERLQALSEIQIIISVITCLLSLVVGIFLFVSARYGEVSKARNTISAVFSGVMSAVSLSGSLVALRSITFSSKLDVLDQLYKEETSLQITRKAVDWKHCLEMHGLESGTKDDVLKFLKEIVQHMQLMLISRIMWTIAFSLTVIVLAAIAVYTLFSDYNESIFLVIDGGLIIISATFLSIALYVLFLSKIIIPRFVDKLSKGIKSNGIYFNAKPKISELIEQIKGYHYLFLWVIFGIPVLVLSFLLGLISRKGELRRTDISNKETECIINLLYGSKDCCSKG